MRRPRAASGNGWAAAPAGCGFRQVGRFAADPVGRLDPRGPAIDLHAEVAGRESQDWLAQVVQRANVNQDPGDLDALGVPGHLL